MIKIIFCIFMVLIINLSFSLGLLYSKTDVKVEKHSENDITITIKFDEEEQEQLEKHKKITKTDPVKIQMLKYGIDALPEWCESAFSLNVKNLVNSPFFDLAKESNEVKILEKSLKEIDVDLYKDIETLSGGFSVDFHDMNNQKKPDFVLFVKMKYNKVKLIEKIKENTKDKAIQPFPEKIKGYDVLNYKAEGQPYKMAFLNEDYILVTTPDKMKSTLETIEGKGKTLIQENENAKNIIDNLNKNNILWFTVLLTEQNRAKIKENFKNRSPLENKLYEIIDETNAYYFTIHQDANLNFSLGGYVKDEQTSKKLKEALDLMVGQVKLISASQPGFKFLETMKTVQNEKSASIQFMMTKEDIEVLKNNK